jgi:hypothetical protein
LFYDVVGVGTVSKPSFNNDVGIHEMTHPTLYRKQVEEGEPEATEEEKIKDIQRLDIESKPG